MKNLFSFPAQSLKTLQNFWKAVIPSSGLTCDILSAVFVVALVVGGISGWVMNIVKIIGSDFGHIDGELVIRIVGVPISLIGAVMGYVP